MHWQVLYTDEERDEFNQLPAREQTAMIHAVDTLAAQGSSLSYLHSSAVRRAECLRALRLPGGTKCLAGIISAAGGRVRHRRDRPRGPGRQARGFGRTVAAAQARLDVLEEGLA